MRQVWIFTVFLFGLWNGVSEASMCTARGRFTDEDAADCKGYTMCIGGGTDGTYTQYHLSCPGSFIYSHIDHQCTNITGYECYPQYNCTSEGNFTNENDPNCTSYIACINGLSKIETARLVECPENTLYSAVDRACVNSTQFSCHSEETPSVLDAMPSHETSTPKSNNAVNLCSKCAMLLCFVFGLGTYINKYC